MSLEQLMKMEVTTASKRAQAFNEVPAAIYVITSEDIRRSGTRNIPELLRGVPGLQVGQVTSNSTGSRHAASTASSPTSSSS